MMNNKKKEFKNTKVHNAKFNFSSKIHVHEKIQEQFHEFNEFQYGWPTCTVIRCLLCRNIIKYD